MEKTEKKTEKLDKFLDFILTKNTAKYLTLIVLFGAILRYLMARNVSFLGDEMFHGPHAINILKSKMIGTALESPVWHYLTDISHAMFGINIISSRLTSIFFGTATIFLIYLLASYLFDKKVGLITSALLAISAFNIRYTLIEMDLTFTFFVLLSVYFLIKGVRENNNLIYYSAVFLGIGVLNKTIALFFAPPIFLYLFFSDKKIFSDKKELKKIIKKTLIFGLILLLVISPLILYNYLLYQDKGYTDLYVGQYFNINKEAQEQIVDEKYLNPFSVSEIFKQTIEKIKNPFLSYDAPIFLLALAGIILSLKFFRKKENYLLLGLIAVGWFLQTGSNTLPTHYIPYSAFFAIYAGYGLNKISENKKLSKIKKLPIIIILAILIINLFFVANPLADHLTSSTGNKEMREFVKEIPEDALVIADSRIYSGRSVWLFNDKIYMESGMFQNILVQMQEQEYNLRPYNIYFVECAIDDCGWGTVKDTPGLNQTTEALVSSFSQSMPAIKEISTGGGYNEPEDATHFKVYNAQVNLPEGVENSFQDRRWLFHPLINKGGPEDQYHPQITTIFHKLLWLISYLIIWISIIMALLAPFLVIHEIGKQKLF